VRTSHIHARTNDVPLIVCTTCVGGIYLPLWVLIEAKDVVLSSVCDVLTALELKEKKEQ